MLNPFESFKTNPGIQAIHLDSPQVVYLLRNKEVPTPRKIHIETSPNDALVQIMFPVYSWVDL